MLTPFRHLLGRAGSASDLAARVLREIEERWPRDDDQPVDLARLHAEVLASVFQCGPATGPLEQGSDRPSRRAAAAEAYFAPEGWWAAPPPEELNEAASRAERRRQARYALAYAILESAIRERPPANLLSRLTGRVTLLLTDPYYDGRAPWQRHDHPDLTTCLVWLAAIPGGEALALIGRIVDGAYNTGPHAPPPEVSAEPEHSYHLYAPALHDALPACLARLSDAGQLDPPRLHRARLRFPRLLEAASDPPEHNAFFHAVGPGGAAILAAWAEREARDLAGDLNPTTLPLLKQIRQVRGVWSLECVAGHLRRWNLDHLPTSGYQQSDTPASGLAHLLRIARPAEGEEPAGTAARLRALGEATLLLLLPLTPGYRAHLLAALDWPGAAELVDLIERLTGLDGDRGAPGQRLRLGPRPGVVEPAALERAVRRLGAERLHRLLFTYQQHLPSVSDALLLIEALLGTGAERVREGVARRRLGALAALGLLPLEGQADLRARHETLTGLVENPPGASPERQRLERSAARAGLLNLAATTGHGDLTRLAWALDEPEAELPAIGQSWMIDERHHLRLVFDGSRPLLLTVREGAALREPPPTVRAHPLYQQVRARVATLRQQAERYQGALEQHLADSAPLTPDALARLARHPVAVEMLRRLLVVDADGHVGLCAAGAPELVTLADERVPITGPVRLAHPLDLIARDELASWQRRLVGRQLVQPIRQVFRESYWPLPAAALASADEGRDLARVAVAERYAGRLTETAPALALLHAAGWTVEPGLWPYRDHEVAALRAVLSLQEPDDAAYRTTTLTLGPLFFLPLERRGAGSEAASLEPVPLQQVPPALLNEGLRVADRLVTLAQPRGQSQRLYSAATIERRADLIRTLAGLRGLDNVAINGHRALVSGRLGTYLVHLGNGVVQLDSGRTVGLLPAARQRPAPYQWSGEPDQRTGEIVTTVLLLAADDQITDETTLAALRATG